MGNIIQSMICPLIYVNGYWIRFWCTARSRGRNCIDLLGNIDFLKGFTSLDTSRGIAEDSEYLEYVADTILTSMNRNLVTENLTSLRLIISLYFRRPSSETPEPHSWLRDIDIDAAARLIGACKNLESLDMRIARELIDVQEFPVRLFPFHREEMGGLLNEPGPFSICTSIVENLKEMSVKASRVGRSAKHVPFLKGGHQPIPFKRLSTLRVVGGTIETHGWSTFLNSVQDTLTTVVLCDVLQLYSQDGYHILPFPLDHLTKFIYANSVTPVRIQDQSNIPGILSNCPKLEHVGLTLNVEAEWAESFYGKEQVLASISSLPELCDVHLVIDITGDAGRELVDNSKLKLVDWFNEKITHLELMFQEQILWIDLRYTVAIDHIIDTCTNLTAFVFSVHNPSYEVQLSISNLVRLFSDQERAAKFRRLDFCGGISSDVLDIVFENCLNLDSLSILSLQSLNDGHLIKWAERGAKPKSLRFQWVDCEISDRGLDTNSDQQWESTEIFYICSEKRKSPYY